MPSQKPTQQEMCDWIIEYTRTHTCVCSTDQAFHEAFYERFGGARKETLWGAQPVSKAMKLLKKMHDTGEMTRTPMGLGGNWQPGFPKWNYVYSIASRR